nr:helix-turn-helix domain-containing protein [Metabacillus idriensis]
MNVLVTLEKNHTNLLDKNIMSSSQACREWGIDDSTLRKRIDQFPRGTIRKFGKTWVVTSEGMQHVFGEKRTGR